MDILTFSLSQASAGANNKDENPSRLGYKQTELGEIPQDWEVVKLEQLANIRRGASPRPINDPKYFGGNVGWIRISDVTKSDLYLRETEQYLSELGESKSVRVRPGDLIMSICATIGIPIILDMDACIHDGFVVFSNINPKVDKTFLLYWLKKLEDYFERYAQPGAQKNLNTDIVKMATISLPPLEEQKRIVAVLSEMDTTIAATDKIIAQLQQLKQELMTELLTRGIGHTEFKQSELGEIPRDWEIIKLGDILEMKYGFGLPESKREYGDYPVFGANGIVSYHNEYAAKGPAVIIGRKGSAGLVQYTDKSFWPIDTTYFITSSCTNQNIAYLYRLLGSLKLEKLASFGAIPGLNRDDVYYLKIALPPLDEQERIANLLNEVDTKIEKELEYKAGLEELRQDLMPDLLSGQVRIPAS